MIRIPYAQGFNNRQPSVLNRNGYRCVDGESSLFEPETFQKNERGHAIPAGRGTFRSDLYGLLGCGFARLLEFLGSFPNSTWICDAVNMDSARRIIVFFSAVQRVPALCQQVER